jgi:hypothetical protein
VDLGEDSCLAASARGSEHFRQGREDRRKASQPVKAPHRLLWFLGWLLNRLPPWCAHWAPRAVLEAAYRQRLRDWLER